MPEIILTTRENEKVNIPFNPGTSLMQAICEGGISELMALCGGVCSCATCHVHVEQDFFTKLEPMTEDEDDLLSGSLHRKDNSRLSCQVMLKEEFDGMKVTVAEED